MRAENLHLTLAFLGDCEEGLLTCLEEVGAALTGQPFELIFDRLGHFQRARVLWLGLSQTPRELLELQEQLVGLLASRCGVPWDGRPFTPHLTLRRNARHPCPWPEGMPPVAWYVRKVALIESFKAPSGVRYQPIRVWLLTDAPEAK